MVLDTRDIRSVWFRRPGKPNISQEVSEPSAREFSRRECESALSAFWQCLDAIWVNHPDAIRIATRKPHQLRRAKTLGFRVPDSILSTDPEQIREFYLKHKGRVVFKALHQDVIEIGGRNFFAYASALAEDHLMNVSQLTYAPTIFQEYVEPRVEIRVTVVGDSVFAASIDTLNSQDQPDWRRLPPDQQPWTPFELPSVLSKLSVQLVRAYGLAFGAIDLIQARTGEYFFLELNANGQWVWIELLTGLRISDAMLALLSGRN